MAAAVYAYSQLGDEPDRDDGYDYGDSGGNNGGYRPHRGRPTPWYRKPVPLVGLGVLTAVALWLIAYSIVAPSASEHGGVAPTTTPSITAPAVPSSPATTEPATTVPPATPQTPATTQESPATQAPATTQAPDTTEAPTTTEAPVTTSSSVPSSSRPSVVIVVPADRRPRR